MWRNIQLVFRQQNVTNVVWVIDYSVKIANTTEMNSDCSDEGCPAAAAVAPLWPGDDAVDWVFINVFEKGKKHDRVKADFPTMLRASMQVLRNVNRSNHCQCVPSKDSRCRGCDLASKPWGLGAFGSEGEPEDGKPGVDPAARVRFLRDAAASMAAHPELKAYLYYDSQESEVPINGSEPEVDAAFRHYLASPQFAAGDAGAPGTTSLGDRLTRDYMSYAPMPISRASAESEGWVGSEPGRCVPGLGQLYTQSAAGTTPSRPLYLYFTPAGQLSGAGVSILAGEFNTPPLTLIAKGFFILNRTQPPYYTVNITLGFRSASAACSTTLSEDAVGDRLVINPEQPPDPTGSKLGHAMALPLTPAAAQEAGWVRGSCFAGMGSHWFKDLTGSHMTWTAANLLPVVLMFDEESANPTNAINAIFFASSDRQQALFPPSSNQWEAVALPNQLMCRNFCDKDCTFHDTSLYSTLHLYFKDHTRVTCDGGCQIGCCGGH
eukprot:COSAG01_NODE_923_length_12710_cov_68.328919_1_plen_492_part_00